MSLFIIANDNVPLILRLIYCTKALQIGNNEQEHIE